MASSDVQIIVIDHMSEVTKDIELAIEKSLKEIGMVAERYASENAPVVTGRLKGSITYATKKDKSAVRSPAKSGDGVTKGQVSDKYTVVIGTNVEYAESVELHSKRGSRYLTKAANNHGDEYREIVEKNFKEELSDN